MEQIGNFLHINPESFDKLTISLVIAFGLTILRILIMMVIKRKVKDPKQLYYSRRTTLYLYTFLLIILIGPIWIKGIGSLSTFLGLAGAGLAIAMHDTIANITGWLFILWRRPFKVGDRVQIEKTTGDVIDIRLFQFSLIEVGNWVDADQSSGRIIHVPNLKVLREPLANYHIGFEYIWHEIPVLITFESDWEKAKKIILDHVVECTTHLTHDAEKQIKKAAEKYMVFYGKLTPIVYTTVRESGVLLTVRYIVDPRKRRVTEQTIWEDILLAFNKEKNINLAYPTTRFYTEDNS
ncbi:MAG: mechanosensitive ion channel family protein [Bacteroidota bacterium]|nr:mechanosensitive ion channel family protein [Bacteroidota bacterium]